MTRRLTWTREETILAAAAASKIGWRGVNARTPIVVHLSELLRRLPIHNEHDREPNFRSPSSVGRKINSMRAARPDYVGTGLRVIPLEEEVALQFLDDPSQMRTAALEICARYGLPSSQII